MVELPRTLYEEIVGHAQAGWPDEVCGLIGGQSRPDRTYRIANTAETPQVRYLMDPAEQFAAMMDIEGRGWVLYGIYHSHPSTEAYPSATDRGLAFYPDAVYLICSLADREKPVLRAFMIIDDEVREQGLRITEADPGAPDSSKVRSTFP
ncbi:MAG: M67 family metallopeptidase [Chloroflexia bacterium]|nr:M67 family metallopeptidase [Chloroflexia bacterium]